MIRNDGSAPLHGIELGADPPADWELTFDPEVVAELPPGESAQVVATVTPSREAIVGDYLVTVTASVPETTAETDLRATIEASRVGGSWACCSSSLPSPDSEPSTIGSGAVSHVQPWVRRLLQPTPRSAAAG